MMIIKPLAFFSLTHTHQNKTIYHVLLRTKTNELMPMQSDCIGMGTRAIRLHIKWAISTLISRELAPIYLYAIVIWQSRRSYMDLQSKYLTAIIKSVMIKTIETTTKITINVLGKNVAKQIHRVEYEIPLIRFSRKKQYNCSHGLASQNVQKN